MSLLALAAGGCGSVPLDPAVPTEFDLNGQWVVHVALSDPPTDAKRLSAQADQELVAIERSSSRSQRGILAFVTQDFPVLASKTMVIEQDRHSMGIRYDKGGYRDISWGERKRGLWEVSAGWRDGALVIASRAHDATARETMRLVEDGWRMVVHVKVKSGGDSLEAVRTFDRVAPR